MKGVMPETQAENRIKGEFRVTFLLEDVSREGGSIGKKRKEREWVEEEDVKDEERRGGERSKSFIHALASFRAEMSYTRSLFRLSLSPSNPLFLSSSS